MKVSCKMIERIRLPYLISLGFTLVLTIGTVVMGFITIYSFQDYLDITTGEMEEIMRLSELSTIDKRLVLLSAQATSLFSQGAYTVNLGVKYAEASLNASRYMLRPPEIYPDHNFEDAAEILGAAGSKVVLRNITGYYTDNSSLEMRGDSSLLHNVLVPFHLANSANYESVYVGFDDGFYRLTPFGPVDTMLGYATKKIGCMNSFGNFSDVSSGGIACTRSECETESQDTCETCGSPYGPLPFKYGFDPRCRQWYDSSKTLFLAAEELSVEPEIVMTDPYIDASTGTTIISVAKGFGFGATDSFAGVFSLDITSEVLKSNINSASVMENGYSFLVSRQGTLIASKKLSPQEANDLVTIFEKDYKCDHLTTIDDIDTGCGSNALKSDAESFATLLSTAFTSDKVVGDVIGGNRIRLLAVEGTEYVVGMRVPESDIRRASDDLRVSSRVLIVWAQWIYFIIGGCTIAIGGALAWRFSTSVAQPVVRFTEVLRKVNDKDTSNESLSESLGSIQSDFAEVRLLESRIVSLYMAVRFSTNAYYGANYKSALAYLLEVEKMFAGMEQQYALGVVYNNKAEILRSIGKSKTTEKEGKTYYAESLSTFEMAVENARTILQKTKDLLPQYQKSRSSILVKVGIEDSEPPPHSDVLANIESALEKVDEDIKTYSNVLSNRMINMSNVYRDMEANEDALNVLRDAENIAVQHDDQVCIARALVSEALTQDAMGFEAEAIDSLTQALSLTNDLFGRKGRTLEDISAYQMTLLNTGTVYYMVFKRAKKDGRVDVNALQKALEYFYLTLVVHGRIRKDIITRCLRQLVDLFTNHFGEAGIAASEKLLNLYPDWSEVIQIGAGGKKTAAISFLIDVSASMLAKADDPKGRGRRRRIDATVDTMCAIFDSEIENNAYFSVSLFGQGYTPLIGPLRVSDESRPQIVKDIKGIPRRTNERRTYFWAAIMSLAASLKNAQLKHYEERWIVALTDGGDNDSRSDFTPKKAKEALKEAGVTLIVVAVDMDQTYIDLLTRDVVLKPSYVIGTDSRNLAAALQKGFRIADSGGDAVMESL